MATKLYYHTKHSYKPGRGRESSNEPSQAVPGQSMSMKETVERYRSGMATSVNEPVYFDEEDLEKINRFYAPGSVDLTDLDELKAHVSDLQNSVDKAIKAKEIADKKAEMKAQMEIDLANESEEDSDAD